MTAPAIAKGVREVSQTVRNWRVSLDGGRDRRTQRSTDAGSASQHHWSV